MELVVGASAGTMKSLMGKLGGLLAQEYTLITGVNGDLQYINDELATMQSFLRAVGGSQDDLMTDWLKQIRDITYDIEDCIDDSGHRLHGLRADMCCYFLVNSVYEVITWWPRRHVAARISVLKTRAHQIGERRSRYGVSNPNGPLIVGSASGGITSKKKAGFNAAENQESSLQLVGYKEPVGVDKHMGDLKNRVTCITGFGGVGKTAIANALYRKCSDQFSHHAVVTVSQTSDVDVILKRIEEQVKPQPSNHQQQGGPTKNCIAAATRRVRDHVTLGISYIISKCHCAGTSEETRDRLKLKADLEKHFNGNSYLVLIDDVWSELMLNSIINALPDTNIDSRIIVTTRFNTVATTRRQGDVRFVEALNEEESQRLFREAFLESKGSEDALNPPKPEVTKREEFCAVCGDKRVQLSQQPFSKPEGNIDESIQLPNQPVSEPNGTKEKFVQLPKQHARVPDEVWKMCRGRPLAIVTMAGHVACNRYKSRGEWLDLCRSLFPESAKDHGKAGREDLTQEEVGRIVSYCYDDMPAEIKTCSLYLSIFPKGHKISRKHLIRRWIAEGFVFEKHGLSVEDVAETYFNHLIRRKIIRPAEHSSNGKVKNCIVHDMVLELIVAKAGEENFITVVGGNWLMQPSSSKIRRLSLQGSDSKHGKDTDKMNLSHVRSLTMFESLNNQLHSNSFKFGIVQVLDLEGCKDFKHHHIKEICELLLLKYLSLRGVDINQLPDRIRKLKNLETLDVRNTNVVELPTTICHLERLVNILGGNKRTRTALKLPEELKKKKKMKALRILSGIEIMGGSADFHHLTDLRKLTIYKLKSIKGDDSFKELKSSIEYLSGYSLRTLVINDESSEFIRSLDDMSSPPKFLVALELSGRMVKLPSWITQLSSLTKLILSVTALLTDNLKDLSSLEALFSLTFLFRAQKLDPDTRAILARNKLSSHGEITVPDIGFKSLKLLCFSAPLLPPLRFPEKAMPELERLELRYGMLEGLFGAENLAKLKRVHFTLDSKAGEHITDEISREIEGAFKRIGKETPLIIRHQSVTD